MAQNSEMKFQVVQKNIAKLNIDVNTSNQTNHKRRFPPSLDPTTFQGNVVPVGECHQVLPN